MRCVACNKLLSDFESTRKSVTTGEYLDLCNHCFHTIQSDAPSTEREDLRDDDDTIYDDDDDLSDIFFRE